LSLGIDDRLPSRVARPTSLRSIRAILLETGQYDRPAIALRIGINFCGVVLNEEDEVGGVLNNATRRAAVPARQQLHSGIGLKQLQGRSLTNRQSTFNEAGATL